MNQELPDNALFNRTVFHKRNVLGFLLSFSRKLMKARQACLLYGTDGSGSYFLPPGQWDRGIIDKFTVRGMMGPVHKIFGRFYIQMTGQSPIYLYRTDEMGNRIKKDGVIAYTLRNHKEFYDKGIKIILIDDLESTRLPGQSQFKKVSLVSYDGREFNTRNHICADTRIASRFMVENFVAAYIPDYGAIAFNTVSGEELIDATGRFIYGKALKLRLNLLISCIENASIAHLGRVRGKAAARMIWRKERGLRQSIARLQEKERMLEEREKHLWAVGAVTPAQLNMPPVSVYDGVYGFMDMAGSVKVSKKLPPKDYFYLLNCCHEIAAEKAGQFGCRVDNIIGDAVFFQNVPVLDLETDYRPGPVERLMLMALLLASILIEINQLLGGAHPLDRERRVYDLVKIYRVEIGFRAGMNQGRAQVGCLGSRKRKLVTAIGEAVDLASRLESSGRPNYIHTLASLFTLLDEAWVSRGTCRVYNIASAHTCYRPWKTRSGFYFFDFYKAFCNIKGEVAKNIKNAKYKEFSSSHTCLIRCLPDSDPDFCAGI